MIRFNIIVAVAENFGIGFRGNLPWHIKSELKYFSRTTKRTSDPYKHNAVIMGKNTYFSLPERSRPLAERLNVVLSTTLQPAQMPACVVLSHSLEGAMQYLEGESEQIENVWIVGGSGVYAEAIGSWRCHKLYITKVHGNFECDTFFPAIPYGFNEVALDYGTPEGVQEENGIRFEYKILEKQS